MATRARVSAWLVFISMAGTTMSFQVYHSVKHGYMPWPLAVLYGIVPLFVSMLVIEFVSRWNDAPKWAHPSAYLLIGGAMYLSATATGAVVLHAAPNHSSLLFGLLLDGAAILAARFLMTAARMDAAAAVPASSAGDGTGSGAEPGTGVGTGGAAGVESAADDAFGELLKAAREYRDELTAAGNGERLTKDRLRLRLGVGSGKALEVLKALKKEDQGGASESSGAVG